MWCWIPGNFRIEIDRKFDGIEGFHGLWILIRWILIPGDYRKNFARSFLSRELRQSIF
jgi:hypothetical protein